MLDVPRVTCRQFTPVFPDTLMPQLSANTVSPPSALVDYPARDMTITVGAGMSFGELSRILQQENQQLPIDVADDAIPLGKMVADDVSGPRQFGYGTLRDYVIGIEAVAGDGRVFHAGGRVVKNVAGYDLCRLLIGSREQLGTITQLTFKLKPIPIQSTLLVAGFRSLRDLDSALERLNLTSTTPVIMDVVSRFVGGRLLKQGMPKLTETTPFADAAALLVFGFEGPQVACDWQSTTLKNELQGTAAWVHTAEDPEAYSHYCTAAQRASVASGDESWLARLSTLPSRTVSAITVLQESGCEVFGRAGNGVLFVRSVVGSHMNLRPADESKGIGTLQSLVSDGVGSVDVLKSATSRSTQSSPAVQEISRKLQTLLGAV